MKKSFFFIFQIQKPFSFFHISWINNETRNYPFYPRSKCLIYAIFIDQLEPQVSLCGNGVVEDGEECDCGWEEDCRDQCCFPQRRYPPIDEPPCHLTPHSRCSPSQVLNYHILNLNCDRDDAKRLCHMTKQCAMHEITGLNDTLSFFTFFTNSIDNELHFLFLVLLIFIVRVNSLTLQYTRSFSTAVFMEFKFLEANLLNF